MSDARVTVVMRTRDRPLLLGRALDSVLSQTMRDWHLVLVNDGGDAAPVRDAVAIRATRFGDRLTVLDNADPRGMEAASNQALAAHRAPLFAVHDDDDAWNPAFLHMTVQFLDAPAHADHVGVAAACTLVFERIEDDAVIEESRVPLDGVGDVGDLARLLVRNRCPPICLLYRRRVFDALGGYDATLPVLGDWHFNQRAALLGEIGVLPTVLAFWHQRRAGAYGNTVTIGRDVHAEQDRRLRNARIRDALRAEPALRGVLQPLLQAIDTGEAAARIVPLIADLLPAQQEAIVARVAAMLPDQQDATVTRIVTDLGQALLRQEAALGAAGQSNTAALGGALAAAVTRLVESQAEQTAELTAELRALRAELGLVRAVDRWLRRLFGRRR